MLRIPHHARWAIVVPLLLIAAALTACQTGVQSDAPFTTNDSTQAPYTADRQTSADATLINMTIANRASDLARADLRVRQGQTVRLAFDADEAGEIHLHGYDLTAAVAPGQPGVITLDAHTAGGFGINFHVFAPADAAATNGKPAASNDSHSHDHSSGHAAKPESIDAGAPIAVAIAAQVESKGTVDVAIDTEAWQWAPDQVDAPHVPGTGHAHIYVDGVKISRVFAPSYRLTGLTPGAHEIRVTLNSNNHHELLRDGLIVEARTLVTIPHYDITAAGSAPDDGHGHSSREIIAEVHLGNLEVYP